MPLAVLSTSGSTSGAGSQFGSRSIGGIYSRRHHRVPNMQVNQTRMWGLNSSNLEGTYGLTEMDSHADTACLGKNFRVIAHTDRVCKVFPYHPDYPPMSDVPIVQVATDYDDPESGETFVLVVNQGLHLGEALENSLFLPNQLRAYGVVVDDIPKHLAPDPNKATHSIWVPNDDL